MLKEAAGDGGGGVEPLTKFSERRASQDLNFERGFLEKRGVTFLMRVQFLQKSKLKSEIFNEKKKFINKNIFLCHN